MFKRTLSIACGGAMALAMTFASAAHADSIRYRYVALDKVPLPAPYTLFAPSTVIGGRVYGTVFDSTFSVENVAVYHNGAITIGPAGSSTVANVLGVVGGASATGEAALFSGSTTTLIPALPGAASSNVVGLTDYNLALVESFDPSFTPTFAYYHAGTQSVINFGLPNPASNAFMNQLSVIGLTKEESATDPFLHAYRYSPVTGKSTPLPTFSGDSTDVNALAQGINFRGEVLGYSFTTFSSPAYHERIGVWNTAGVFQPYFYETINTSLAVFNDFGQIVISNSSDGNSYLIPTPGTRLNLATLIPNLPAGLTIATVVSIDNLGNLTGFATDANFNSYEFLLQPMLTTDPEPGPPSILGCKLPEALLQYLEKRHTHH